MSNQEENRLAVRALAAASVCTTLALLPPFLLGALSFSIRQEMEFDQADLGIAIASFFAVSAVASVPGGKIADRIGPSGGMFSAVIISVIALLGIAILARSWWHLVAFHVIGGCAAGISSPATSLALARHVPTARQGLAFGLSKGAGPMATMLAGLAVPAVAVAAGWRWAYAFVALGGVLFLALLPPDASPSEKDGVSRVVTGSRETSRIPLVLLALGAGFGIASTHAMASFFVEAAISRDFSPSFAGSTLALGSLVGVLGRAGWGWTLDHGQGSLLTFVAMLMAIGGAGTAALGWVESGAGLMAAVVVAFGAGWGWSGIFVLAVVRLNPRAPASATGFTAAGMYIGGTVGPVALGSVAHSASFVVMWVMAGASLLVGAVFVLLARTVVRWRRGGMMPRRVAS